MLSKGQKINDRYEIIKTIGEGGMANVYLATDIILNRKVAVKVLRGDLSGDEKFIRRFQREALSASNLSHSNIVEVYDVGEEEGNHYIVMEYVEGKTLKQLIQKRNSLTLPEVLDIMMQITDGMAHAHDAYIIHRDIKPQNILILDNGLIKITDFGIAMALNATQLTQTNSVMGSVHYLPPEQANGRGSTIKSDIYSIGIVMYELLTGSVPFKGENAVEIALKHMKEKLPSVKKINPVIPQSIENILLKACAKNPKNRYDDVREMYKDLSVALDNPDEKRYVYSYPETDMDETKIIKDLKHDVQEKLKGETKKEEVEVAEVSPVKKENKNTTIWTLSIILISLLIIGVGLYVLLPKLSETKEILIPDVVGLSITDAEKKLRDAGFKVATNTTSESSDTINEGLIIGTNPSIGRTVKETTEITLIQSSGTKYYMMEEFVGKNYIEIKTLLENVNGLHVLVEKKDVEKKEDYKDKADIIIEQTPAKDTKLVKGDTVTLYIPNIVSEYPDMVSEGWTLSDTQAFATEYNINLEIEYRETTEYAEGLVLSQSRAAKSKIVQGTTLKVVVASKPKTDGDILQDVVPNAG